jgi:hypothetical protein
MDEQTILAELVPAVNSLKTLALVALDMEDAHPMALPEPPEPDKVAAYERQMTTIAQQVNPRHRALLTSSLQDYRSGFPDRAGNYLQEMVTRFLQDPEYASAFSPAGQKRLRACLADIKEV